jgi:sulfur-oxidizing protein SoxX
MKTRIVSFLAGLTLLVAAGCLPNPKSGRGFHLPSGNAEKGKAAFVQLKCTECHRVEGVDLTAPTVKPESIITLGGEVSRLRSYGELVTAIIHPARDISTKVPPRTYKSPADTPMKDVNRQMTVEQLVDLVTFLQPTYRQIPPAPSEL